ncbi:hypothetical protein [Citrobacter freundii]|uniref:hypothetical protein n=1 Tax=Citrobacter freundii TaxID=546 RepID=UPI001BCDD5E6|nr:hypothetical protein [Citrobacter freundii]ELK7391156.1 hypothetical protein [Citrobacter freundii]MEB7948442.1 hypothetical protein [Citrobacter freundii]
MTKKIHAFLIVVSAGIIFFLCIFLSFSRADLAVSESDNRILRNDNALQGQVIATQAFNFNRFNQVADNTSRLNSLIDVGSEKTVIEYREILRREKNCDFPVPADIADGLLDHAYRLRASAMYPDPRHPDAAGGDTITASSLTYCQAVLWIGPLLATIEKGNNQLSGIRKIELERK